MKVLVVGATGATGRLLVEQLTKTGCAVTAIVRNKQTIPAELQNEDAVTLIEANVLDLSDEQLTRIGGQLRCHRILSWA